MIYEITNAVNGMPACAYDVRNGIRVIEENGDLSLFIDVSGRWVEAHYHTAWNCLKVINMAPEEHRRHAAGANKARREAGLLAMKLISNVEVRSALMLKLDLLSAMFPEGMNFVRPPEMQAQESDEQSFAVVRLVCPSTGRVYAHVVPGECRNEEEARRWIMTAHAPAAVKDRPIGKVST